MIQENDINEGGFPMEKKYPAAGVVGTGFIGPVHVEALRRIGVPVLGLVSSSLRGQRRFLKCWVYEGVWIDRGTCG
jgi:hypothetical protein